MGDPRKQRRKYSRPGHPWQKERIEEEKALSKEYGLRNKQEIWKMNSLLRNFFSQTKKLTALDTEQAEKEKIQLLKRLKAMGLLSESADLNNVLELTLRDILERRLQSIAFRKGKARSMIQARQFITHGHIAIGDKKITSPSFLVLKEQENNITFVSKSSFNDDMHPERVQKEASKKVKKEEKKETKGKPRLNAKKQDKKPVKEHKKVTGDKK